MFSWLGFSFQTVFLGEVIGNEDRQKPGFQLSMHCSPKFTPSFESGTLTAYLAGGFCEFFIGLAAATG